MAWPLWKSLAAPQNVKHEVTMQPSNSTPRYKLQRNENKCLQKNVYVNVHGSIIHDSQKVQTTEMPTSR